MHQYTRQVSKTKALYIHNLTTSRYLMGRIEETFATFPDFLTWKPNDATSKTVSDFVFWKRLMLRLIRLEHQLLLERLAYKQGLYDGQSMVDCAREMLELTVLIWVQRDRFSEHHHDYDWMLMCWGVPSSGVLCVEVRISAFALFEIQKSPGGSFLNHSNRLSH